MTGAGLGSSGLNAAALERLAGVRVGLRNDLEVVRQTGVGGRIEYVVHDPVRFTNNMFSAHEYRALSAIDLRRTLGGTFDSLCEQGVLDQDERTDFFEFVLMQHNRGLLRLPISDGQKTWQRARRRRARDREAAPLRRLLHWRVPVWNPDAFLDKTVFAVRWLFGPLGLLLWGVLMVLAIWNGGRHFMPLLVGATDLLALNNIVLLWGTLVVLKVLHEFGHAYACKALGGAVPEMGLAFVLTTPCAYVDASASWKFANTARRVWVSMAGMYVESIVAAIALMVWVVADEGVVRTVAHNVVVLATAVTVFFNINPLMRFDGYYVFSDLVREPNLRARSDAALSRFGRALLGLRVEPPSERAKLLLTYGVCAFVYKTLLAFGIVRLVMFGWPVFGLVLGLAFAWMLIARPVVDLVRWLWSGDECGPIRIRARVLAATMVTVLPAVVVLWIPAAYEVDVPGIVVARQTHVVRAPFDGFVREVRFEPGATVGVGEVVARIESSDLDERVWQVRGDRDAARAEREAQEGMRPTAANLAASHERVHEELLVDLVARQAAGSIRAPIRGSVVSLARPELVGRFVREGEPLLTLAGDERRVDAYLPARDLERSRIEPASSAEVRSLRDLEIRQAAFVVDIDRRASRSGIPDLMSDLRGGGPLRATVSEDGGLVAEAALVRLQLDLVDAPPEPSLGTAVRVRFKGRVETVGDLLLRLGHGALQQWSLAPARR